MTFERIRRMISNPVSQKRDTIYSRSISNGLSTNMDFESFINIHEGGSFIICGCGTSLNLYEGFPNHITIGVNDASSKVYCKYLVVVNEPKNFKRERWPKVFTNTADRVFTHLPTLFQEDESKRVVFKLGTRNGVNIDNSGYIDYTNNSPYMAAIIAYQMGAKKIGLIGVDFTQDHFFGQTGTHILNRDLENIIKQYTDLANAFIAKGIKIANLSPNSALQTWPKMTLKEFETI